MYRPYYSNMDFLKANNKYNGSLTAGYTVGDGTLAVNTVPSNTPTIVTVARGTDFETRFTVTGTGSGLLTGVTRLDGANVDISSGVSVECMIDEDFINQLEAAVFNQSGLKNLVYAADGGSNDTYAITLAVAPTAYTDIIGLPIVFKANTANTGAATLNVNSLGAKTIKKLTNQDLSDNDILVGQAIMVVYDGTNFQMLGDIPSRTKSITSITSSATPTPNADTTDDYILTALAAGATFGAPTGTPTQGQPLVLRIKDNATARTLAFNAIYRFSTDLPAPTTTVISKTLYMGFIYNSTDTKWDCVAVLGNF